MNSYCRFPPGESGDFKAWEGWSDGWRFDQAVLRAGLGLVVNVHALSLRLNLGGVGRGFVHDQLGGFGGDVAHLVDQVA